MALMNRARLELQSATLTNQELAAILKDMVGFYSSEAITHELTSILIIDDMEPEEV